MRLLTKLSLWAVFPLVVLNFAPRTLADAVLSVEAIASQIQPETEVPVLLPDKIPGMDEVYANVDASPEGYYVSFDYTADCKGATACNYGGIAAERGGQMIQPEDVESGDTLESVTLTNGIQGQFANACGAYCTAMVVWESEGVVYSAYIKNGRKEDVVELANLVLTGTQFPSE